LINGLETAWVSDLIRTIKIDKAAHNAQPLNDAEFDENTCDKFTDQNWAPTGLLVTPNQYTGLTDITPGPIGEKILYKNKSFNIIDPSALETLVYLGRGSYPVEFYRNHDNSFPAKFRWVEKGIIVYIYSRHNKKADFSIDVTPGNVDTAETSRHFIVSVNSEQHQFAVDKKSTLAITGIKLHQGLNCLVVKSPDNVIRRARNGAIVRKNIPLDPRVNNFAISGIKLTTGSTITNYQ
jgi:hypothetical protein